ncbi:NDR1/HIN1-like protein 13 [Juglans microcarpa x Juglans regia]|uniref:NDR1/HIN1-like protein 13 n=1 Tax=Juglans microcarpa x Juglans regia TaxID=2249226 RepID=UPI001B7F71DC|nr:NDR1/HIN1-like protein 13 [Juglans microcarpa x Juglans regia]
MEGRVSPVEGDDSDDDPIMPPRPPPPPPPPPLPSSSLQAHCSKTYVIQIPKNQIYRIPPPENAIIAEHYRTPDKNNKNKVCCSSLWIIGVILVAAILIGLALVVLYFMFSPKVPIFSIAHVLAKNNTHSSPHKHSGPRYEISMDVKNPNQFMAISYKHRGVATLSFKGKKIAKGEFPTWYQGENSSKRIKLFLQGANAAVPYEIGKTMNGKKSKALVSLALDVKVPVKVKFGAIKTWSMDTNVACKLKVSTLGVGSRILSQECHTEFKF